MAEFDVGTLSAVLAGSGMFTALMPPLAEVRRASTDSATARDVHTGVAMGGAALVGSGLVISIVERSAQPLFITLVLAGLMAGIYEVTLRQAPEPGVAADDPPGRWS